MEGMQDKILKMIEESIDNTCFEPAVRKFVDNCGTIYLHAPGSLFSWLQISYDFQQKGCSFMLRGISVADNPFPNIFPKGVGGWLRNDGQYDVEYYISWDYNSKHDRIASSLNALQKVIAHAESVYLSDDDEEGPSLAGPYR